MDINARSVEDAMKHYDFRAEKKGFKPFYIVKAANQPKFSNTEDDINLGREILEMNLQAAKQVGNTSTFSICFYKRLDKNMECSGVPEVFNIKLNDPNAYNAVIPSHNGLFSDLSRTMENIDARMIDLESKLNEEDQDEEEEDEGLLGGITKDPEFKKMILSMFFNSMAGGPNKTPPINGVPGEDEKDKIRTSLQILSKHTNSLGDDLTKLATIAQTNPSQFDMLINMLRKM